LGCESQRSQIAMSTARKKLLRIRYELTSGKISPAEAETRMLQVEHEEKERLKEINEKRLQVEKSAREKESERLGVQEAIQEGTTVLIEEALQEKERLIEENKKLTADIEGLRSQIIKEETKWKETQFFCPY